MDRGELRVQLVEVENNLFVKNEQWTYTQLRKGIYSSDDKYFNHPVLGRARKAVLNKAFRAMQKLTDLDKKGNHKLNK